MKNYALHIIIALTHAQAFRTLVPKNIKMRPVILLLIIPLFISSCKKETKIIDLYLPEVELISAKAVALTTYEISYSISPGNKEKLDSAVIILDDITVLSAPDITKRITLTLEEKQTDTLRIKLERMNHDYSVRIKLFSGDNIWLSNNKVIRSAKCIFKVFLGKSDYSDMTNNIAAIKNNTDSVLSFRVEYSVDFSPQTTEVLLNGKTLLRHKIDFDYPIYSSEGLGIWVSGFAYLPKKLPEGVYDITVVLDSINFPADSKFMLLEDKWVLFGTAFNGRNLNDYASFIVNDNLFLIESDPVSQQRHPAVWKFDLNTRTWVQKNNFPVPETEYWELQDFNLQYENRGFVLVLNDISALLWEYNYENDSFSLITTYPGQGRDIICFISGDYLYAGCGRRNVLNIVSSYTDFWRYNLVSKGWEKLSDTPIALDPYNYQVCSGGGKGYVYERLKKALWQFDPESTTWMKVSIFPGKVRRWTKMAWLNDKVYLVGGETPTAYEYLKDCWIFSPETNSWTLDSFAPAYPTGFVCQYQNKILMGLGRSYFLVEKNIYSLVE